MWRCLAIAQYPDHTDSLVICVNVVICDYLILSLREAGGRATSRKPVSNPRYPSDVIFATQASDITNTYGTRSKKIPLQQHDVSTDCDQEELPQTHKLSAWHEMQPVRSSTTRVLFEVV